MSDLEKKLFNSTLLSSGEDVSGPRTDFLRPGGKKQSLLRRLEPRIMFDAAAVATGIEAMAPSEPVDVRTCSTVPVTSTDPKDAASVACEPGRPASSVEPNATDSVSLALATTVEHHGSNSIVFLDAAVEEIDVLLAGIGDAAEVILLDSGRDGVEQIAEALADRSDVDAVHIISHGEPGELRLGNSTLTETSMRGEHADEMAVIRGALSVDADLLIYGCDFGADARGASAVQALADATGADVAASIDDTGHADLGGDWDLEVQHGVIEAEAMAVHSYHGLLTQTAPANSFATLLAGNSIVVDGVTITATTTGSVTSFAGDAQLDAGAHINPGFANSTSSITLNFSSPITEFSTTFEAQQDEEQITFDQPATSVVNDFNSTYGVATPILSQATLENGGLTLRSNLTAQTGSNTSQSFGSNSLVTWVFSTPVTSLTITHTGVDSPLTTQPDPTVPENTNYNGTIIGGAFTVTAAPANTPPIIDLNSDASIADTDRDHSVVFMAGGSAVNVTASTAGASDADGDNYQSLTISPAGIVDGGQERISIAGQTFQLDGVTDIRTASIAGTNIEISYIGGGFTVAEASDAALTEVQLEAIMQSIQYENTSGSPTLGNRTFDFQAQQADGSFVIDFEEFTADTRATSTQIESDVWWGGEGTNSNGSDSLNGFVLNASSAGSISNAEGNYLFHNTGGVVPSGAQIVFGRSNVPVEAGRDYSISLDLGRQNAFSAGPFEILVDGTVVGTVTSPPVGSWQTYEFTFNSGAATAVDFEIRNTSTNGAGNDFGIDNITFTPTMPLVSNIARATIDVTAVIDTDGDGVFDVDDVDDDNDGILDINEVGEQIANFTALTTPLTPGDADIRVETAVGGLPLNVPFSVTAPVSAGGAQNATISSEAGLDGSDVFRLQATPSAAGATVDTEFTFDAPALIEVSASNVFGPSNLTDLDQIVFTAVNPGPGFQWLVDSSNLANIQINGNSITVTGTSPTFTDFAEFVVRSTSQLEGLEITYRTLSDSTFNSGRFSFSFVDPSVADSDRDGILDSLDIDSDNDGITDNIEAQATDSYIAPSGIGGTAGFVDANNDGLDDNYDARSVGGTIALDPNSSAADNAAGLGLLPVDSDGDTFEDFLDTNSDDHGANDTAEAALGTAPATGLSDASTDADGDGLFDVFDTQNGIAANDGFVVNEGLDTGAISYLDTDADASATSATPLTADVDFRDASDDRIDTDGDGVLDINDIDDDNDGILDTVEMDLAAVNPPTPGTLGVADAFDILAPGFYQVLNQTSTDGTAHSQGQLFIFDPSQDAYVQVGTGSGATINATGFDTASGFIYGIVFADNGATDALGNALIGGDLVRMDRDGEVFRVAATGVPVPGAIAGDVYDGSLYVNSMGTMYEVDLVTGNTIRSFAVTSLADYVQVDGVFYGLAPVVSGEATLTVFDVNAVPVGGNPPVSTVTVSGFTDDTSGFGAAYAATNTLTGEVELYFAQNGSGIVYRVDGVNSGNATAVPVATGSVTSSNDGAASLLAAVPLTYVDRDSDGDGIADRLDIDSDNDGIADNIEAQATDAYIAPSGIGASITDFNDDGLDDNYDPGTLGTLGGQGLTPVDSDGDDIADYLDTDSDDEGGNDTVEAGLGAGPATGLSDASTDADGDGLFDVFDTQNGTAANDGFVVNEGLGTGAIGYPDTDGDASATSAIPLINDVDFRDTNLPPVFSALSNGATDEEADVGIFAIVSDDDATITVTVSIDPAYGTLTAAEAAGATVAGSGTAELTITGLPGGITTVLEGARYVPAPDFNTSVVGQVPVMLVADDGNHDPVSGSFNITVNPVQDTSADSLSTDDITPITFNVLDGTGGAAADNFENIAAQVTAVTQPMTGGSVSIDNADGTLIFTPTAGFSGQTTFTYTVTSGGVTETETVTINVGLSNRAPTSSGNTITVLEDNEYFIQVAEFNFADVDGDSLQSLRIDTLPANGTLLSNGVPVAAGQVISISNLASLSFIADTNASGAGYTSFTYSVNDGTVFADNPATMTINVTPANDAPVINGINQLPGAETITPLGGFPGEAIETFDIEDRLNPPTISVSDLIDDLDLSDVESNSLSVAIISATESGGVWQYLRTDIAGHSWTNFDPNDAGNLDPEAVASGQALLLAPTTELRFMADADFLGSVLIDYRIWDGTQGTASNGPSSIVDDSGLAAIPADVSSLSADALTARAFVVSADTDGDGVLDIHDVDDDNDGILDTVEGLNAPIVATSSGIDGAIGVGANSGIDVTFGITSTDLDSPTETHILDSITIGGTVYTDLIAPDSYTPNLPTGGGDDVAVRIHDSVTTNIDDTGYANSALQDAFQNRDLNAYQQIDTNVNTASTGHSYTLGYDNPIVSTAGGFFAITERSGNNSTTVTAYDAAGNLLGTVTAERNVSYIDTGARVKGNETAEIAIFAIDDLAPVGSQISRIEVSFPDVSNDGPDGKVFFFGDEEAISGSALDSDGDGIFDHQDIDSDNDGITDNIEAQLTDGYVAPSGVGGTTAFTDLNGDGLDDTYDDRTVTATTSAAIEGAGNGAGLLPVNTDAAGAFGVTYTDDITPDYIDTDADGDGVGDADEAGHGQAQIAAGTLSDATNDADGDGLFDVFETAIDGNTNDGFVVSEGVTDPLTAFASQNGYLPDDGDAVAGSITPLTADLNYRDAVSDNDPPIIDLNDDNTTADLDFMTTFTEGDGPISVTGVAADKIDPQDNVTDVVIVVAGLQDGASEELTIAGQTFSLNAGQVLNNVQIPGTTTSVNIVYSSSVGNIVITNAVGATTPIPEADFDVLLRGIRYENTSEDPTAGDRTLSFTATDDAGATTASPAVSTIAVVPLNDPPVVVTPISDVMSNDADAYNGAVAGDPTTNDGIDLNPFFSDVDHTSADLTITATDLPPGLSVVNNQIVGTIDPSASQGGNTGTPGQYSVTVTAEDPGGETVSQTFTWTVANPVPVANDDVGTLTEDESSLAGNVIDASGANPSDVADNDPDGDVLSVTEVTNGGPALAVTSAGATTIAGDMGGVFAVNSDGSYTFTPGVDFQNLAVGEDRISTVTYTLTDADGATDTATLSITVTGVNDPVTPQVPGDPNPPGDPANYIPDQTGEDGVPVTTFDLTPYFSDADASDTVSCRLIRPTCLRACRSIRLRASSRARRMRMQARAGRMAMVSIRSR